MVSGHSKCSINTLFLMVYPGSETQGVGALPPVSCGQNFFFPPRVPIYWLISQMFATAMTGPG